MSIHADEDDPFEEQRENADNPMRRLFFEYGGENRFAFVVGVVSSLFARILNLLPPIILGVAVDALVQHGYKIPYSKPSAGQVPFLSVNMAGRLTPATETGQFWFSVVVIGIAFGVGAMFHWGRNWGWNSFAQNIQHSVRTDTYDKMQRLDMEFFSDKQTGEMMSILSNDVNRLERFLNDGMNSAFRLGVMVIAIAAILFTINWQLALVALVPVPLIALFTYKFIQIIQPKYADVRSSVGKVNSRLENNLGGIQVIKTSNTESFESDRVNDVSSDYFGANWDAIVTRIKFFPSLQISRDSVSP